MLEISTEQQGSAPMAPLEVWRSPLQQSHLMPRRESPLSHRCIAYVSEDPFVLDPFEKVTTFVERELSEMGSCHSTDSLQVLLSDHTSRCIPPLVGTPPAGAGIRAARGLLEEVMLCERHPRLLKDPGLPRYPSLRFDILQAKYSSWIGFTTLKKWFVHYGKDTEFVNYWQAVRKHLRMADRSLRNLQKILQEALKTRSHLDTCVVDCGVEIHSIERGFFALWGSWDHKALTSLRHFYQEIPNQELTWETLQTIIATIDPQAIRQQLLKGFIHNIDGKFKGVFDPSMRAKLCNSLDEDNIQLLETVQMVLHAISTGLNFCHVLNPRCSQKVVEHYWEKLLKCMPSETSYTDQEIVEHVFSNGQEILEEWSMGTPNEQWTNLLIARIFYILRHTKLSTERCQ